MIILEVNLTDEAEISARCTYRIPGNRERFFRWKRRLDQLLAAILLVPGLPIIGLLTAIVRLTTGGPGIYKQVRVGKGGKSFTMYKIRTMRMDAETRTGAVWTQTNDPRITRLGSFLRKVHLDELPQLFNVLRGEMSLVGPRPERPEFVRVLMDEITGYTDRLAVLPGVTGLSQINLPPDTDLNSVRRKQYLDVQYVETANLWLDIRMIACTSLRLIGISGTRATKLTCLHRSVPASVCEIEGGSDELRSVTPAALTSESLRTQLAAFGDSLDAQHLHVREKIDYLLAPEPANGRGSGHTHSHGNGNGKHGSGIRRTSELAIRKPK